MSDERIFQPTNNRFHAPKVVPKDPSRYQAFEQTNVSFIGNGNDGGDHTVYSVPVNKFNQNQSEWAQRTLFYLN